MFFHFYTFNVSEVCFYYSHAPILCLKIPALSFFIISSVIGFEKSFRRIECLLSYTSMTITYVLSLLETCSQMYSLNFFGSLSCAFPIITSIICIEGYHGVNLAFKAFRLPFESRSDKNRLVACYKLFYLDHFFTFLNNPRIFSFRPDSLPCVRFLFSSFHTNSTHCSFQRLCVRNGYLNASKYYIRPILC